MRVLHYGLGENRGGIEVYLYSLATELLKSGIKSEFLISRGVQPAFARELAQLGCEFHEVTPRSTAPIANLREVRNIVRSNRFDILHYHAASSSYASPVREAVRAGLPVVWHSHNSGPLTSPISRALHHFNRATLPWVKIEKLAVSSRAGKWAFGDRSFRIIYNGIDLKTYGDLTFPGTNVRSRLGIEENELVLGHIGLFSEVKNQIFSLQILREVLLFTPKARLLLVGDGPLRKRLEDAVRSWNLEQRVSFLGIRQDVPELLSAVDVVLLPSLTEGFSLVAIEAQAAGATCLVSEGVPQEVLVTKNVERLSLTEGPSHWSEAIQTRSKAVDQARLEKIAMAGFTIQKNAESIVGVYREAVSKRPTFNL